jgi:hypothetical protein
MLESALADLARGREGSLDALFHVVETGVAVNGTSAICHFHCLNLDGNGRPRVDALTQFLITQVVDYAIPRKRILEAHRHQIETGSTERIVALVGEAAGLFSRLAKSGEGGELILFLMAERLLKLPQLICKMNLKTSTQMHYHGADGLHLGVDSVNNKLCLYWGESKLHADPTSAVYECMKSLAPLLLGGGGSSSPEARDLQLLGQYMNVEDESLERALKAYLDPDNSSFNSLEFRGLCLVGFNSLDYPSEPNSATITQVTTLLRKKVTDWQGSVVKRLVTEKIDSFVVHVFMVPFPSVDAFRAAFKTALHPGT